jgi:UDP-N-acetylglucosamine--N-acetylmuramyl-(pentapeptide) pyrophosphoryl-undecaprenol N-acetylglucosamine transferase
MMPKIAGLLLEAFPALEIVHQAGGRHGVSTGEAYERAGLLGDRVDRRVRVQPYLDAMVEEIAASDLVLCRSGASTVAELAAAGKPSVLVPFPQAADDHQRKNADVFVAAGAAEMIVEAEMTPEGLLETLSGLLKDDSRRAGMGEKARGLAHPDAVRVIGQMAAALGVPPPIARQ